MCEIVTPEREVVAWAVDELWAVGIVAVLNRSLCDEPEHPEET